MNQKHHKSFLYNYWLVIRLWLLGTLASIVCIAFISIPLQLWLVVLVGCVALFLILAGLTMAIVFRCKVDVNGITLPILHWQKKMLLWDDISKVHIICCNAYMRYHTAYIVEFTSGDFTIKFKTYRNVIDAIIMFSKNHDSFQNMFSANLEKADMSY